MASTVAVTLSRSSATRMLPPGKTQCCASLSLASICQLRVLKKSNFLSLRLMHAVQQDSSLAWRKPQTLDRHLEVMASKTGRKSRLLVTRPTQSSRLTSTTLSSKSKSSACRAPRITLMTLASPSLATSPRSLLQQINRPRKR